MTQQILEMRSKSVSWRREMLGHGQIAMGTPEESFSLMYSVPITQVYQEGRSIHVCF